MALLPPDSCSINQRKADDPETAQVVSNLIDKHVEYIKANNLRYALSYIDTDNQVALAAGCNVNDLTQMAIAMNNGIGEMLGHMTGKPEADTEMRVFSAMTYVAVEHLKNLPEEKVLECMERWLRGMKIVKMSLAKKK